MKMKNEWRNIFTKHLKYKGPHIENKDILMTFDPVFAYVDFIKPGRHSYIVNYLNDQETNYLFHTIIPPFTQDVFVSRKTLNRNTVKRVFKKETSVFKHWLNDNAFNVKKTTEHELTMWKVSKFVKDPNEQQLINNEIMNHAVLLKTIFAVTASKSNYPTITWIDFVNFTTQYNIPEKYINQSTLDRIFIATKVQMNDIPDLPERDMTRFEFYESLVRMAGAKYKDNALESNYINSLRRLFKESILPNADVKEW